MNPKRIFKKIKEHKNSRSVDSLVPQICSVFLCFSRLIAKLSFNINDTLIGSLCIFDMAI